MRRPEVPGPQIEISRAAIFSSMLGFLIFVFFVLVIFSFIQVNFVDKTWGHQDLWKLKIIDISDAITILVTLLGLQIAQKSFVEGLKPFICYTSQKVPVSKLNLSTQGKDYWSVSIQNQGKGAAVIRKMSFRIAFKDKGIRRIDNWTNNASAIRQILKDNSFKEYNNYAITFLSDGASIGSDKAEIPLFEILFSDIDKFEYIDFQIVFEGFLGHKYSKTIYCLPINRS